VKTILPITFVALAWISQTQAQSPESGLAGTSWQLANIQGDTPASLAPADQAKYTVSFGADGHLTARIDCNRGTATWKSSGANQLQFGPLALTRGMCPPESLQGRLAKDLEFVRSWAIENGHLLLSITADGRYEFAPMAGPAVSTAEPKVIGPIHYSCPQRDGTSVSLLATFYNSQPGMVMVRRANQTRRAYQVRSADGAKYEGPELMFWDARGEAQVTWSGVNFTCKPEKP
jgi:heat shock protein HslJ